MTNNPNGTGGPTTFTTATARPAETAFPAGAGDRLRAGPAGGPLVTGAETAPPTALPPAAALALLVRLVEELSAKVDRDAPELWTREQLAAALNISMSSLAALEASGGIGPQPLRLGGSGRIVRYRVEAV